MTARSMRIDLFLTIQLLKFFRVPATILPSLVPTKDGDGEQTGDRSFAHLRAVNNRADKVERTCGRGRGNRLPARSANLDGSVLSR